MEQRVFCLLVLSGLYHSVSSHPKLDLPQRKYYLISQARQWHDARRFCGDHYRELASVRDERDLEDLADLVGSGFTEVYIGLKRWWGWTRSDADDYKEGEPGYRNWANKQPANHDCGLIGHKGGWFSEQCSRARHFFCYNGSASNVSERFVPGHAALNWMDAQAYCRNQHTDLARVRNKLENQELQKLQKSMKQTWFWMGLTRSFWDWSDGSKATFTPWRPNRGQTSGSARCSVLQVHRDSVGLADINCNTRKTFVCYKDVSTLLRKHVVRLTLAADSSSVDMSSPAVRESILKQVEKTLRDQIISEYLTVSWVRAPERDKDREQDQRWDPACDP